MTIATVPHRPYPLADRQDEFSSLAAEAASIGWSTIPPVERIRTEIDGLGISALKWGAPKAVLLHGIGLNARSFDPVAIAVGGQVLCPDLPGHGHSDWRTDLDYSPRVTAPLVAELLDRQTDGPVTVVGHSWGGLIALQLLADRPDLVSRLVLVDITPEVTQEDAAQIVELWRGQDSFADREEIVAAAAAAGFGRDGGALRRGVLHNTRIRPDGRVVWAHHLGQLGGLVPSIVSEREQLWSALGETSIPVTLVRADQGFLSETALATVVDRAPAVEVVTVASGHNVQELAPLSLAPLVVRP